MPPATVQLELDGVAANTPAASAVDALIAGLPLQTTLATALNDLSARALLSAGVKHLSKIAATTSIALVVTAIAAALLGLAAASTAATDTNVSIVFRAYQPAQLTVLAGQTVTWRNSGLGPHTVTADAGQFGSGTLPAGATFSYTFSAPGTYLYSCTIHPTMHGSVVALAGLPPGFPVNAPLNAVLVHLSKRRGTHGRATLVHVQAARPGATALLQVQSLKGSWATMRRAQLSSIGKTTFSLSASVHRRLRVVVRASTGETPLISKTVRTAT